MQFVSLKVQTSKRSDGNIKASEKESRSIKPRGDQGTVGTWEVCVWGGCHITFCESKLLVPLVLKRKRVHLFTSIYAPS